MEGISSVNFEGSDYQPFDDLVPMQTERQAEVEKFEYKVKPVYAGGQLDYYA